MKEKHRVITLKQETFDLLQSIKSVIQLKNKQSISYDELISKYVSAGLNSSEPEIARIMELISTDTPESSQEIRPCEE